MLRRPAAQVPRNVQRSPFGRRLASRERHARPVRRKYVIFAHECDGSAAGFPADSLVANENELNMRVPQTVFQRGAYALTLLLIRKGRHYEGAGVPARAERGPANIVFITRFYSNMKLREAKVLISA